MHLFDRSKSHPSFQAVTLLLFRIYTWARIEIKQKTKLSKKLRFLLIRIYIQFSILVFLNCFRCNQLYVTKTVLFICFIKYIKLFQWNWRLKYNRIVQLSIFSFEYLKNFYIYFHLNRVCLEIIWSWYPLLTKTLA